jgi:hypothetical protein
MEGTMYKSILSVLIVFVLSGCAAEVKGPSVKVGTYPVSVDYDDGNFCPPGQAKKGRC